MAASSKAWAAGKCSGSDVRLRAAMCSALASSDSTLCLTETSGGAGGKFVVTKTIQVHMIAHIYQTPVSSSST